MDAAEERGGGSQGKKRTMIVPKNRGEYLVSSVRLTIYMLSRTPPYLHIVECSFLTEVGVEGDPS